MKVALFVHCFFPDHVYGTETYTFDVARNLRAMGHDPVVMSAIFPGEPQKSEEISRYEYETLPVYCIDKNYFPNTRIRDTYYQPEIRGLLKELLCEVRPDLIHVTHLINHTAVLLEVAAALHIPVVATFTDFFGFCFNNKLEAADGSLCYGPNPTRTNCLACYLKACGQKEGAGSVLRFAGKHPWSSVCATGLNLLHHAAGLRSGPIGAAVDDIKQRPNVLGKLYSLYRAAIAPTRFLRDAYLDTGLTVPVHEIRFGVDVGRSPKPKRKSNSPIKFGFIGQIAPHKGTDILINAFCRLPKGTAELHIFGPEKQDARFMDDLKQNGKDFAVYFRGTFPREQMSDTLTELDFVVIPSRWYENSPLVLLQALASHTPVIVSNVKGMTEFVCEGQNGYIFSRGDVSDLERILAGIIEEPDNSRNMSSTTEYTRSTRVMAEDVVKVYDSVVR